VAKSSPTLKIRSQLGNVWVCEECERTGSYSRDAVIEVPLEILSAPAVVVTPFLVHLSLASEADRRLRPFPNQSPRKCLFSIDFESCVSGRSSGLGLPDPKSPLCRFEDPKLRQSGPKELFDSHSIVLIIILHFSK
jgi:hypothetical protein